MRGQYLNDRKVGRGAGTDDTVTETLCAAGRILFFEIEKSFFARVTQNALHIFLKQTNFFKEKHVEFTDFRKTGMESI